MSEIENYKKVREIEICVVGWYYFENLYKHLKESEMKIFIIAHRHNEILDKYKLKYFVKDNVGLEYGAYDYYINNIWDGESDVFFMHDDIEFEKFDEVILFNHEVFRRKKIHHASIVSSIYEGDGERFMYLSKEVIQILLRNYRGIWYDKENFGYNNKRSQPEHWAIRRYNDGGPKFKSRMLKIEKKYNILTYNKLLENRITLYNKGKRKIQKILTKEEQKERKKMINRYKKNRKTEEKNFRSKYGNNK